MSEKLKPCPFCGSTELGIGRGTEDREGFPTYVYCSECGAQGPWIYTRDKAVFTCTSFACEKTGWNKRQSESEIARLRAIIGGLECEFLREFRPVCKSGQVMCQACKAKQEMDKGEYNEI